MSKNKSSMTFLMSLKQMIREMKNQCQSFELDSINIALKHCMFPEHTKGQIKEFDDNTVHENTVS